MRAGNAATTERLDRWLPSILFAAATFILFYQLGTAALFERDEGRNAEKAREILLLRDWVTPHENFHPVLDKPIFFYWLIAFSFKLFGVSEWAARFPSALAALGCVGVIYYFARSLWGRWVALWSGLILLTNLEFFVLARVVILDMPLTFFLTLALCAFYQAGHTDNVKWRMALCLLMYSALAAATLIKGLIGIVAPGMVIFFYLLLSKRWSVLRRLYLIPGTLLVLALVLPWYLEAGARHEGYLRYFFWEEHFGRFATTEFDRTEPWYYFIVVGLIGFFPWSFVLPFLVSQFRTQTVDDKKLFVILWAALPFLLFSLSRAKLPHYILPIFPALAVLTAAEVVSLYRDSAHRVRLALSLTWIAPGLVAFYFIGGMAWPQILPAAIRDGLSSVTEDRWLYGALLVLLLAFLVSLQILRQTESHAQRYVIQTFAMLMSLAFTARLMTAESSFRSAKELAGRAVPIITPATQVVLYDTYFAGMTFYLRSQKPLWVITHNKGNRTFLGNYYALSNREQPLTRWGKAILDLDEFHEEWKSAKQPMVIFVKKKRLEKLVGEAPRVVGAFDETVVLSKP